MINFLFLAALLATTSMAADCTTEPNAGCPAGQLCMIDDGPECFPVPAPAPLSDLFLPFDEATAVVCTHSSGIGSHAAYNSFYALDLDSPYDRPPAIVRAAADGKAFVFLGEDGKPCPENPGTPKSCAPSNCGDGFGNRVKVLHANGYFTFYAHLDRPLVKTGDRVKRGQPIGVEGCTGLTPERQLHWSVNLLPGNNQSDWKSEIAWTGQSVPFAFRAKRDGKVVELSSTQFQCPYAKIGEAGAGIVQPWLSGP